MYASAIAFRALIALVPLALLGLGLLGALGLKGVWRDTLAPAVREHVTRPVYDGVDSSVEKVLSSGTAGLLAFAALLLLWDLMWAVWLVMEALNRIHGVDDGRPFWHRLGVAAALAVSIAVCLVGAALVVTFVGRVDAGSIGTPALALAKWLAAIVLLGLAVALLLRYAPAEHPEPRWASAGSAVIVATWVGAALFFRFWVASVANFRSATGQLTVFLVLTAFVFVSSAIFLVGAELDELLRDESEG